MARPLQRLPGETRIEMMRRSTAYECYREQFTKWILEEGRSHSWIAVRVGKSRGWVSQVTQALEIFTREPKTMRPSSKFPEAKGDTRQNHHVPKFPLGVHSSQDAVTKYEHTFQRMRLAACSAWDRGW